MAWTANVRVRLSVMMFLQYAFQGIWIIPMGSFLTKTAGYSFQETAWMYNTVAIGFIIAPFFVGMIADRFFSAQKVLGVCNIIGGILLAVASQMAVDGSGHKQPYVFFAVLLLHTVFYAPTWALTNTISLNQMTDAGKQFPGIRVMGTFGWIAVSAVSLFADPVLYGRSTLPMMIGAGIGIVAGLLGFFMPNTPPKSIGHRPTFGDIIGIKALKLFKDRNFLVFAACSFLIFFPNMFYWGFAQAYFDEIGMTYAPFKQSIGQMAEVIFLFLMPLFFIRWGVKAMLSIGFMAWAIRFACLAFGFQSDMLAFLLYIGIALHGICFDFFFVTGQLYTDKKAAKEIQASAQGLITLITFGLGWFVGTLTAGSIIDSKATAFDAKGNATMHDWQTIWLLPVAMAAALLVIFLLGFKDKMLVVQREGEVMEKAAIAATHDGAQETPS